MFSRLIRNQKAFSACSAAMIDVVRPISVAKRSAPTVLSSFRGVDSPCARTSFRGFSTDAATIPRIEGPLSPQQVSDYHRDGFLVVRGGLNAEETKKLLQYTQEVEEMSDDRETGCLQHYEMVNGVKVISRSERFMDTHAGMRQLALEGSIPKMLHQLYGEEAYLFKEKVNYKSPGGGHFRPHQDAPAYWETKDNITALVSIDDAAVVSGCLEVAAGWHKVGVFEQTNDEGVMTDEFSATLDWQMVETKSGDITFFSSYAPHRSGPNTSPNRRRVLYLTYNAASEGHQRAAYYRTKDAHMEAGRISLIKDFTGEAAH